MVHDCTDQTDLDELIGKQCWEGQCLLFRYGPLARAMKIGEELILENSEALSPLLLAKLGSLLHDDLFIDETAEQIHPPAGFRLTLQPTRRPGQRQTLPASAAPDC
ncbi:MAG TPA: hypothetical protein PLO14_03030 [Accumulibacter sp.]|uniref:hypothetical protein n=1 Tax=Accumulibacter sp. TaxID=2053492 RepID=UPI0025EB714C|nr:hypothetical protein [Accumulibacter sp.]MCM8664688.1 hypothetical protein [Accumulibacter sp.]HNC51201.1 hypothetical protein [Accumulibacter sp.]